MNDLQKAAQAALGEMGRGIAPNYETMAGLSAFFRTLANQPAPDLLESEALDALDALKHRLDRIHTAALDGRPKQAYGEMVHAMTQMPEWETIRAALKAKNHG